MKQLFSSLFLFVALLMTQPLLATETREPTTSMKDAVSAAEAYVHSQGLSVSGLFLSSVYRSTNQAHPENNCWMVIWAPNDPSVLDGELRVYIYDSGRVAHGGSA